MTGNTRKPPLLPKVDAAKGLHAISQMHNNFILVDKKQQKKKSEITNQTTNLQASKEEMKLHPSTEVVTPWGHSLPGALFCLTDFEIYFL